MCDSLHVMRMTVRYCACLAAIAAIYVAISVVGISWGLPTRAVDPYLFGGGEPWSGEKIYRLAHADEKLSEKAIRSRGADVDVDPVRRARGPHRKGGADQGRPVNDAVAQRAYRPDGSGALSGPSGSPASHHRNKARNTVGGPILLTATDEDVARIYLRYRLYTYQPDEMITMMALAGMNPGAFKLDPRLYQYGGLWIYPVGGLIKLCGVLGLVDVRSDLVFYLDHPDEFGKFYMVARAYAAAWGLLGVFVVFAITRRMVGGRRHGNTKARRHRDADYDGHEDAEKRGHNETRGSVLDVRRLTIRADRAGLLAALLFTVMPVVVCMAHEGKPHLPGAVLMLLAVYFAMRAMEHAANVRSSSQTDPNETTAPVPSATSQYTDLPGSAQALTDPIGRSVHGGWNWWMMCVSCGAALGMVLSSAPIFFLIPLTAWLCQRSIKDYQREPCARPTPDDASATPTATGESQPEPPASARATDRIASAAPSNPVAEPSARTALPWFTKTLTGVAVATLVYLVTNPYVFINALTNRAVLASNFGNSLAMYEVSRIGDGFLRVLQLTIEGVTLPLVALGFVALTIAIVHRHTVVIPLVAAAGVFFVQFVLIGAGKPAEYGRFGVFPDTALAIGAAILLSTQWTKLRAIINAIPALGVALWCFAAGGVYVAHCVDDCHVPTSRIRVRRALAGPFPFAADAGEAVSGMIAKNMPSAIALASDPAPYNCPPIDFAHRNVLLFGSPQAARDAARADSSIGFVNPVDLFSPLPRIVRARYLSSLGGTGVRHWFAEQPAPISWAGKPFEVVRGDRSETVAD